MCLSENAGQSPIYNNEPLAAWSRCACAVRLGLLQPQTGRPVTRHCTAADAAHGLTTTTSAGALTRTEHTGSVTKHKTRTHPGGEEKTHHSEYGRLVAWRGGELAVSYRASPPATSPFRIFRRSPFLCGSVSAYFPPSELSYSGRPVEGAASRAAKLLCGCFFFSLPRSLSFLLSRALLF